MKEDNNIKVKIKDMEGKIVTKFKINTFENAKYFNKEALLLESDVLIHSGRFIIDGKSLMGIFSLDLSKPIELAIHTENNLDEIMEVLKPYLLD